MLESPAMPGARLERITPDIAVPLLNELEAAAVASELTLPHFIEEILECEAASRRLPKTLHAERTPRHSAPPLRENALV